MALLKAQAEVASAVALRKAEGEGGDRDQEHLVASPQRDLVLRGSAPALLPLARKMQRPATFGSQVNAVAVTNAISFMPKFAMGMLKVIANTVQIARLCINASLQQLFQHPNLNQKMHHQRVRRRHEKPRVKLRLKAKPGKEEPG